LAIRKINKLFFLCNFAKVAQKHCLRLLNEAKQIEVDRQNEIQFVKNA
jgi:hypothetical protein